MKVQRVLLYAARLLVLLVASLPTEGKAQIAGEFVPDEVAFRKFMRTHMSGYSPANPSQYEAYLLAAGFSSNEIQDFFAFVEGYFTRLAVLETEYPVPEALATGEDARPYNALAADTIVRLGPHLQWKVVGFLDILFKPFLPEEPPPPQGGNQGVTPGGKTCAQMGWFNAQDKDECDATCNGDPCIKKQWCGRGCPARC